MKTEIVKDRKVICLQLKRSKVSNWIKRRAEIEIFYTLWFNHKGGRHSPHEREFVVCILLDKSGLF